jgi:dipeptidyl aminopeptidase/acylaminoacyl peptidase
VRLSDGVVLAELVEPGRNLHPVAFRATDVHQALVVHEHHDRTSPGLWNWTDGGQRIDDVATSLAGDVSASWYPDGTALLLTELVNGRHTLHRLDLDSHELTQVPTPRGTIGASSARPDGSVHALVSSSTMPVVLVRSHDGVVTRLIELDAGSPQRGVAATDVFVDGPAGRVHALVSEPTGGSQPHPTVFLPHGGPTHQDYDLWNDRIAALVDCGFAVVRVNYRGSTGYGAAWRDALHGRLGFIELADITAVRDHLEAAGVVDPRRTSIAGGSWGGFLTLMALGLQPERWRSGAALVPLADQVTAYHESSSFMNTYSASLIGGTLEQLPELYRETSPITYVDAVTAPLLITAGDNDPRCPPRQVDSYVERLTARGHDVVYERVAAGHSLPDVEMKVAEWRKVIDFLARTLEVTPARAGE